MSLKIPLILQGGHSDLAGGHFAGNVTARKVLQAGYWWPILKPTYSHDLVVPKMLYN
jgi:hypothetical protein